MGEAVLGKVETVVGSASLAISSQPCPRAFAAFLNSLLPFQVTWQSYWDSNLLPSTFFMGPVLWVKSQPKIGQEGSQHPALLSGLPDPGVSNQLALGFLAILGKSTCGRTSGKKGYQQIVITKVFNLMKKNNFVGRVNVKIRKDFFFLSQT